MRRPVVLTVAGSDSGGGAGVQADLKTITLAGAFAASVITAITVQNTQGVEGVESLPLAVVKGQLEAVLSDMDVRVVKTGMLWNEGVIEVLADAIQRYGIRDVVVDPVMVAKGGERLLEKKAQEALIAKLFPLASLVTPNIPEAEVLSGMRIEGEEEMLEASRRIRALGPKAVLIKGGHLEGEPVDLLYDGEPHFFRHPRLPKEEVHGTGCVLASAIAAELAKGQGLLEAVGAARELVLAGIKGALEVGKGRAVVDPYALTERELERGRVLEVLEAAFERLSSEEGIGWLLPEVGTNLGYALPLASSPEEVAAFPGRIVRLGEGVGRVASPRFGASRHIASLILAVMQYDPGLRSAMNIRYSVKIIEICSGLGLSVKEFDRGKEPPEIKAEEGKSIPWGVREAIGEGPVPDVIYDRGDWGKEPMVRILGHDPLEVVEKAIEIHRRRDG
ncbi:MAG: bifunctional hydroxymethylpyrimidine kinase/phosphomethylpyrimidine kinase [Deltaproteobacteria bacterium]|nr:MAG: bifunctional hydroxymethylpyrimidine kinase/phosphomethylpyrimidine kinase [Deltaproteobacteria bacterium]